MDLLNRIENLEDDFHTSLQSSISMNLLGVGADEAFEKPLSLIREMSELVSKDNDSIINDIILLKVIDMTSELDDKLNQV